MRIIADIHNHSRFSRACSPQLTLPNLDKWAKIKGVNLLTVADFTYPQWLKECEEQLESQGNGFYTLKGGDKKVNFLFTTEISFIYKKSGKARRVHNIVLAPHLEAAKKLSEKLEKKGFNIRSDGRPILGMSDRDFLEMAKEVDENIEIIPAHIWTPWFSIFGSKSGYNSVEECYGDMDKYIFALETGLSSDPLMNYQVSALDKYILISNSDSHSLKNIAREANIFDIAESDFSYLEFIRILKEKDTDKFLSTVEFYPEEGRYHYDGHRDCRVVMNPQQSAKEKNICPVCKKELTIGVQNRVEELADRKYGYVLPKRPEFKKLVELDKIIAESLNIKSRQSKKVMEFYHQLIEQYGSELEILLYTEISKMEKLKKSFPLLVEGIQRVRNGELQVEPGYDGEYGKINIFSQQEKEKFKSKQKKLF